MPPSHRAASIPLVLSLALLTAPAMAQAPAAWTELAVPGGTSVPATGGLGKLVTYLDGNTLHVYSALLRRFTSTTIGSNAAVRTTNDCVLVIDGNTWLGFASHRGVFEPLPVGPQAVLLNVTSNTNDSIWLVSDNGQLHTFSGFVGRWHSRPLAANAQWAVARHTAVLAQGTLLSGLDAFRGTWVDLVVPTAPTIVDADGSAGFASDGTVVHAFSALHRSWQKARLPANATTVRADDWVVWYGADQVLGYSGVRGAFATAAAKVTGTLAVQDLFTLLDTTTGVMSFSAFRGAFGGPWAPPGSPVLSSTAMALLDLANGTGTLAYSAVLDRCDPLLRHLGARECANVVAYALDTTTGRPVLYSALTGSWHDAPLDAAPTVPALTTTAAAMTTSQGGVAFGARTATFVPLARPGLSFAGNPSSAPLLAWDQHELFAFDARGERWLGTQRAAAGPVQPAIWRTTAMAVDGNVAFGFGAQAGGWSRQPLPEPIAASRAQSESGRISTTTHVFAYSPLPEVVALAQFPEFRRVQPIGAELRLVLPIPATSLVVLGAGRLAPQPLPIPGLGDLQLAATGLATIPVVADPSGDPVTIALPLPAAPSLAGLQWAFQAAVLPPNGAPWLGAPATVLPW
ncbi:MAG: hypothetical protein MUC36_16780 [Planctomycetes bacterium]|jgi:hypothetical protein|nr:hypothetical protein [Planctomycetota bacterium]